MISKILVPVDGSQNAMKALKMGLEMAAKFDAKLAVLSVAVKNPVNDVVVLGLKEEIDFVKEATDKALDVAEASLQDAKDLVAEAKAEADFEVRLGDPACIIVKEAEAQNADCIVMGCRGLSGLEEFLLGSVSHSVVNNAKVPVFVVK